MIHVKTWQGTVATSLLLHHEQLLLQWEQAKGDKSRGKLHILDNSKEKDPQIIH